MMKTIDSHQMLIIRTFNNHLFVLTTATTAISATMITTTATITTTFIITATVITTTIVTTTIIAILRFGSIVDTLPTEDMMTFSLNRID